jgi:hypothetical protein
MRQVQANFTAVVVMWEQPGGTRVVVSVIWLQRNRQRLPFMRSCDSLFLLGSK